MVPLQQAAHNRQAERVDILAVRTESHLGLAQANCVLASGGAIKGLQLRLVHVLGGEEHLDGAYSNVLGPLECHDCLLVFKLLILSAVKVKK